MREMEFPGRGGKGLHNLCTGGAQRAHNPSYSFGSGSVRLRG